MLALDHLPQVADVSDGYFGPLVVRYMLVHGHLSHTLKQTPNHSLAFPDTAIADDFNVAAQMNEMERACSPHARRWLLLFRLFSAHRPTEAQITI